VALARLCLGNIEARSRHHEEAVVLLTLAQEHFEKTGNIANLAQTHRAMQMSAGSRGRQWQLRHAKRALELFEQVGDPVWVAVALNAVGETYVELGQLDEAQKYALRALAVHRELGNASGVAATLDTLGMVAEAAGDLTGAADYFRQACQQYRLLKNFQYVAVTLTELAAVLARLPGQQDAARTAWEEAAALYEEQGRTAEAAEARARISAL